MKEFATIFNYVLNCLSGEGGYYNPLQHTVKGNELRGHICTEAAMNLKPMENGPAKFLGAFDELDQWGCTARVLKFSYADNFKFSTPADLFVTGLRKMLKAFGIKESEIQKETTVPAGRLAAVAKLGKMAKAGHPSTLLAYEYSVYFLSDGRGRCLSFASDEYLFAFLDCADAAGVPAGQLEAYNVPDKRMFKDLEEYGHLSYKKIMPLYSDNVGPGPGPELVFDLKSLKAQLKAAITAGATCVNLDSLVCLRADKLGQMLSFAGRDKTVSIECYGPDKIIKATVGGGTGRVGLMPITDPESVEKSITIKSI